MIALIEKPFKTCRERNEIFEKIIIALELCEEIEHVELLTVEYAEEIKNIETFDNLTNTTPITEILKLQIETKITEIKEKHYGQFCN